jgi:branched-chain amino acid transport system substrate-binding protein
VLVGTVGCGSLASQSAKDTAERAQLGLTTSATTQGTTTGAGSIPEQSGGSTPITVGPGASTAPPVDSSGSGQTPGTSNGSAPGSTANSTTSPAGEAANDGGTGAFTGDNGGATAVGVTRTTLTVGDVASVTGPEPGVFKGAIAGVQAYFAYVNSEGGVYGRQLGVDAGDDGLNCSADESVTASQIKRDFAEVGGFSLYDNCGAVPLKANPDVPDIHESLTAARFDLPSSFSANPLPPGGAISGPYLFYKQNFGDAYLHFGAIYASVGAAVAQWDGAKSVMAKEGYHIAEADGISPTETNFTSTVISMRSKGVKLVDIYGAPSTVVQFLQAASQQNWHPYVTTPGSGYDVTTLKLGGSLANGLYTATPTALYFNAADAQNIPSVALYQQWMHRAAPSQALDIYSVYGWSDAELFVEALKAAGPDVTRSKVLTALRKIHDFSNGLLPTGDPGQKGPARCYVMTKVVNGQFIRYKTPSNQFLCNGSFLS